jgi:tetratricopeptide (TPR) repeat protein
MNLDDRLRAAADALKNSMDPQQVQRDYELLEADYQRRVGSPAALHRLDDEIGGLELEEAAYRLARQYEQQGQLSEAAHWFRKAALVDHADAATRLASVLHQLGDRRGASCWRAIADDVPAAGDIDPDEAGRTMQCATTQAHADEYLNHELPATQLAAIRQHLLHCQECLKTYAARQSVTSGYRVGRAEPAAGPYPPPGSVTESAATQRAAAAAGTTVLLTEQKGRRVVGAERQTLANDLVRRYTEGESIRALASSTGRSYGFVHRVLTESGVQLRQRGGARRRKNA